MKSFIIKHFSAPIIITFFAVWIIFYKNEVSNLFIRKFDLLEFSLLLLPSLWMAIFIHELGHYAACRSISIKPKLLMLASPYFKSLNGAISFKFQGTRFSLNPFPLSGHVEAISCISSIKNSRISMALVFGGGVVFNFFVILVVFNVPIGLDSNSLLVNFLYCTAVVNIYGMLNIAPRENFDGYYMFRALAVKPKELDEEKFINSSIETLRDGLKPEVYERVISPILAELKK